MERKINERAEGVERKESLKRKILKKAMVGG